MSTDGAVSLDVAPRDAVTRFARTGHCTLGRVLSGDLVTRLRDRLAAELAAPPSTDRLDLPGRAAGGREGVLVVLLDWWRAQSDLTAPVTAALARRAAALLGVERTELISDESFVKPAGHGGEMQWHQDFAVYPDDPRPFVTCWVALDDVSVPNGALQVAQGSHLRGRFVPPQIARGVTPVPAGMRGLIDSGATELPVPERSGLPLAHLTVGRGAATAHHCLLWHRSGPNATERARCGVALRFRPPGFPTAGHRNRPRE